MNTLDRLRRTLVETLNLDVPPESLNPDVPMFGTGLGWDSIDGLEIVVALEREFDVIIEDVEMNEEMFASLSALARFLDRKAAARR